MSLLTGGTLLADGRRNDGKALPNAIVFGGLDEVSQPSPPNQETSGYVVTAWRGRRLTKMGRGPALPFLSIPDESSVTFPFPARDSC